MGQKLATMLLVAVTGCTSIQPRCTVIDPSLMPSVATSGEPSPMAEASPTETPPSLCDGITIELESRSQGDIGLLSYVELRCHATGATLSVYESDPQHEGYSDQLELEVEAANELWAQLRAVSLQSLQCDAPGTIARTLRVHSRREVRSVECSADDAPDWAALRALFRVHQAPQAEDYVWPFAGEYWQDEIGHHRDAMSLSTRR